MPNKAVVSETSRIPQKPKGGSKKEITQLWTLVLLGCRLQNPKVDLLFGSAQVSGLLSSPSIQVSTSSCPLRSAARRGASRHDSLRQSSHLGSQGALVLRVQSIDSLGKYVCVHISCVTRFCCIEFNYIVLHCFEGSEYSAVPLQRLFTSCSLLQGKQTQINRRLFSRTD